MTTSTDHHLAQFREFAAAIECEDQVDAQQALSFFMSGWLRQANISPLMWKLTDHGRLALA
jgi:hypothetical protein